jgi:hypothetical protein
MSISTEVTKSVGPSLAFVVWPVIVTVTWIAAVCGWALTTLDVLTTTNGTTADAGSALLPLWMLVLVTLACGIALGAMPTTPWYERLACWILGSVTSTVCLLAIYVAAMIVSQDSNSDIAAGAGVIFLAIPIALSTLLSLGIAMGIGIAGRWILGALNRRLSEGATHNDPL